MEQLPIFLQLKGSPCLVIGGGAVAERKVRLLMRAGAKITLVAPVLTDYLAQLSTEKALVHIAQTFGAFQNTAQEQRIIDGVRLVVVAIDDVVRSKAIAEFVLANGTLCNVVDNPEISSFIFPAIVDRSPVVIAIGTGGNAPVLAQNLKTQIERWLPTRISELALQAGKWRALVKRRFSTMGERRKFWQAFFNGPIAAHLLANRLDKAEGLLRSILIQAVKPQKQVSGEAYIVGAGPGDPGLLTIRAQQLIATADVILYDRLVSDEILDFARKDADFICVGKRAGSALYTQNEINTLLVKKVKEGNKVCRLKGGDPFIFGRGGEEVQVLVDADLSYEIVPGISAALGCAAYAGIPLTYRGISQSVTFATARIDQQEGDGALDWQALAAQNQTLVLYMSVGTLKNTSVQLIQHGLKSDTPVALIENGTSAQQRTLFSTLSMVEEEARDASIQAPAILVVGKVVEFGKRFAWFGDVCNQTNEVELENPIRATRQANGA